MKRAPQIRFGPIILVLLMFSAPSSAAPADSVSYTVFLIGDAGAPYGPAASVDTAHENYDALRLLGRRLRDLQGARQSAVIFLGDNIYPDGLPWDSSAGNLIRDAKIRIDAQLQILHGYTGRVYFIPGNHDWAHHRPDGLKAVRRQEAYVEKYARDHLLQVANAPDIFLPDAGAPGPAAISLDGGPLLVILDSQWWLHHHEKPPAGRPGSATPDTALIARRLDSLLSANPDRHVLVTAHHPLYSNGPHGGHFPIKRHIFPLSEFGKWGYLLPLPIVGSLYPALRHKWTDQDIKSSRYDAYRKSIIPVLERHPKLVYAAGHEHTLQFFSRRQETIRVNTIVSGSGSKLSDVSRDGAQFALKQRGYVCLEYLADQSVRLTVESTPGAAGAVRMPITF